MPRKQFKSALASREGSSLGGSIVIPPPITRIEFPWTSGASVRSFDFGPYYGLGCDEVVAYCQRAVEWRLAAGVHRVATISNACQVALRRFFGFCAEMATERGRSLLLKDVDRALIDGFIHWQRLRADSTPISQYGTFTSVKLVLGALCAKGILPSRKDLFPVNPYPNAHRTVIGKQPLSDTEREGVCRALKKELLIVCNDQPGLNESDRLVVLLMAICLRTGRNPTPMLDLTRDAIDPHPLKETWGVLRTAKHRAHGAERTPVSPDVIFLYRQALRLSERYVSRAPEHWKDRVWLFREDVRGRHKPGPVRLVMISTLANCIERFVERNELQSEAGGRLTLNVSRLRKTLANRVWRLSGGDPFAVARMMGHSARISDRHYLLPTPEMERNHKFVGEALVASWSGREKARPAGDPIRVPGEQTPVGRCRDPYNGALAPKDGRACMDFLSCFRCPSYVLVEEAADLWRLYSFYWFLIGERSRVGASRWAKVYGWIVRLIDEQVTACFDSARVKAARERARIQPHPFWRDPNTREAARAV